MPDKPAVPLFLPAPADGHEERLQRLETGSQETAVRLEGVATKQDYLSEQLKDTRTDLAQRLDAGFQQLAKFDEKVIALLDHHTEVLRTQDERLKPLETEVAAQRRAAKARRDLLKKAVIGLLLAAAGVFATKAGELTWEWLRR